MKHPQRPQLRATAKGSVLVVSLITIVILSSILGVVLQSVSNKYWVGFQAASWQEALFAAEGGADIAMVAMRKSIQGDEMAWTDWSIVKKDGTVGAGTSGLVGLAPDETLTRTVTITTHSGEGNTVLAATIAIDAPTSLKDATGNQWYRVRSTGIADLPGPARVSSDKLDNLLRRLSLVTDKDKSKQQGTAVKVTTPKATRTIECIAKRTRLFTQALTAQVQIKNDGSGLVVDSYDSLNTAKSTDGLYDPTKRQNNGDIGSNAFPIKHDKTKDLNIKNNFIFGDVANNYSKILGVAPGYYDGLDDHPATNDNPLIKTDGNSDPTGSISTNYYRDLPRIKSPGWTTGVTNLGNLDKKDIDGVASTNPSAPSRYYADKVDLKSDTWVVKLPAGASEGYVEMWVKGDIKLKDGGIIQVEPGVHLTVYFESDIEVEDKAKKGAGFDAQGDNPGDVVLLGVENSDDKKKKSDSHEGINYTPFKATGKIVLKDADLAAAVYAPDHNLIIDVKEAAKRDKTNSGKGRNRLQTGVDVYGSFVARTINAKGPANIHYDEQLANVGPALDFGYVTWFEDVNLDRR